MPTFTQEKTRFEIACERRIHELEAELSELQSDCDAKDNLIDDLRVELHSKTVTLNRVISDRTYLPSGTQSGTQ